MDGTAVNRQNHAKDLGVLLDSSLNFKQHIDDVVARGNQLLGVVIRTTNEFRNPMCFKAVYNSIVRSVLEYSCVLDLRRFNVSSRDMPYVYFPGRIAIP